MNISKLPYSFVLKSFILRYVKEESEILWACNKDMDTYVYCVCVCGREKSEASGSSLL